jgi:hypothetical protein
MRPAILDVETLGAEFVHMAAQAWDEYEMKGDRKILFAFLWSTIVLHHRLIFKLVKRLEGLST